jgi:hypothetical protein
VQETLGNIENLTLEILSSQRPHKEQPIH